MYVKNPKGYYRTMWSKSHPDVSEAMRDYIKADKISQLHRIKSDKGPHQNSAMEHIKSDIRLNQKRCTTKNNTITENNKRTIASPAPLPAAGQASATLAERQKDAKAVIERFKHSLGRDKQWQPLTQEQFEIRKAQQIVALRAVEQLSSGGAKYGSNNEQSKKPFSAQTRIEQEAVGGD